MNKRLGLCIVILALVIPLALSCEDTDGDDPYTSGQVLDENGTELCADSCSGATLTECICVDGLKSTVIHDCVLDSMTCSDGKCHCPDPDDCDVEAVGICSETVDDWGSMCEYNGCHLTFEEKESEDCDDEKDNDCDGKTDCEDPSCEGDKACEGVEVNETEVNETVVEATQVINETVNDTETEESVTDSNWFVKYVLFGWLSPWW